jgi:ABC-type transport system involved in multi-copper enzyme maturation permease subunit
MATTAVQPAARPAALPASAGRVSFAGAVRSEFTKIRSVRSTYWTLGVMVVLIIGVGLLASFGVAHAASHHNVQGTVPATALTLFGLIVAQLIIVVLGALTITSEYGTGMIRTSLGVLPQRGMWVTAKGLVFTVITFVTGLVSCFASFFIGQAILSTQHLGVSIGSTDALRQVLGGALFLTVCGLMAFGLGLLIRHTAGAISAGVGLLFVLFVLYSIVANFLPVSWANDINRWIPFNAGRLVWMTGPGSSEAGQHLFAPWNGFAVFCIYAAVALAAGVYRFMQRDA